ncbi:hypothetical protein BVRB_8g195630 isoform B [Beta vulgaris subsp. vulgaris]|nr:hypothetical protein BVRB_8g195630 isoform B [Beta vulgaris subsp. vulgaris]
MSQKYKEGKFILERFKVLGPTGNMYTITQALQLFSDMENTDDA